MTNTYPQFVYKPKAEIAARALLHSGAYLILEVMTQKFFVWKNGVEAPVYTDCRLVQGHPGPFRTLVKALCSSIESNFPDCGAIAGMAEAGIVWSGPVAYELGLPHAFVRKTPKEHGRGRMVEGDLYEGIKVVLVDDLMSGGGTAQKAIDLLRTETNANVLGIQTIVNWGFREMRERFYAASLPYRSLVSYQDILDTACSVGLVSRRAAAELKAFYLNPRDHQWNLQELTALDEIDEIDEIDDDKAVG